MKCPENSNDVVQLKMFHEHAREKYKPFAEENHIENSFTSTVSSNYMEWDVIHHAAKRTKV